MSMPSTPNTIYQFCSDLGRALHIADRPDSVLFNASEFAHFQDILDSTVNHSQDTENFKVCQAITEEVED